MDTSMSVALSAQMALERRIDTVAQNVANLATAGYRAEETKFDSVLSGLGGDSTAFVSEGASYLSRRAGSLDRTDNPLDVAVQGDAWFAISTPAGTAYTRDGRMAVNDAGELTTLAGHQVLDVGYAPLVVDPGAGPIVVARDGMITQNGQQLGAIGLFDIPRTTTLERYQNSAVFARGQVNEVLEFSSNGVAQGFVEGSNVQPVMEISRLITITRAFEAANAMLEKSETTSENAIKVLGDT